MVIQSGAPPSVFIDDEGHGITDKSKKVFLENRHEVYPIQQVDIRWEREMVTTQTHVIGADGSVIEMSGFGIGYPGTGFRGMCWLLDQCGIAYDRDRLRAMDMKAPGELKLFPMTQTASKIALSTWGDDEVPGLWEGHVLVRQEGGTEITINYPDEGMMFDDIEELIDIILLDCRLRGVEWTTDPRLVYDAENTLRPATWDKTICPQQSERIGWNYAKAD